MPKKCKNCGTKIIEYPIWKGQEDGIPLTHGQTVGERIMDFFQNKRWKMFRWYNLIIGDWKKLALLISLMLIAFAYAHDTETCRNVLSHPCELVEKNKETCEYIGNTKIEIIDGMVAVLPNVTQDAGQG